LRRFVLAVGFFTLFVLLLSCAAFAQSIQLAVDLSDAPRNIFTRG
jgi:hypothetical protein